MVKVASYVFFDIETTGLPHKERNGTKITELCFIVALREDLEAAIVGSRPSVNKLTMMFNPQRKIQPEAIKLTGITNEMLKNAPIFKENTETILLFIKDLPKPVCLVAHNGNIFDYKILQAEFADTNASLPDDLLCVDSLIVFRKMHKQKYPKHTPTSNESSFFEDSIGSEGWPDLNVSSEEWNNIDLLCSSFVKMNPYVPFSENINSSQSSNKTAQNESGNETLSFKLSELYKRLLNKKPLNAHRAEDDCLMLLECVTAAKEFLIYTDKYCKNIHDIKPLKRWSCLV